MGVDKRDPTHLLYFSHGNMLASYTVWVNHWNPSAPDSSVFTPPSGCLPVAPLECNRH